METVNLGILKILPTDMFADDTFNAILDDIDLKVVGVAHLVSGAHWCIRKPDTAYKRNDVVRWPAMKSHQYAECIVAGTTSSAENINNYTTGDIIDDGTAVWRIWSLTEQNDSNGGIIKIWLSGYEYKKGDAAYYGKSIYRCIIDHKATSFSADSNKWQEVYASIRPFINSVYYKAGDTVLYNDLIYRCTTDHTSTNFSSDIVNWKLVGNLVLLHEWEDNKTYYTDEVVTHNGQIYRSTSDHVSAVDMDTDSDNWELVTASISEWKDDCWYFRGATIYYNNILYRCISDHTSASTFDFSKWTLLHNPTATIKDWAANSPNYQYQVVRYNGNLYRCVYGNNDSSWDISKWLLLTDSINDWTASEDYVVGQYVNYDGVLYKCITANNDSVFNKTKWQKVSGGSLETWTSNKDYSVGDIVINANKIYQCNTVHTSSSSFNTDTNNWTEISACITRIPNWAVSTEYVVGDLVAHDAKIYRCITAHTSDSTQWNAVEEAKWEELSPTINEISSWAVSTDYAVGQLVIHDNKLYRCNTAHTSDSSSFNTDIAYWDEIGSSGGIEPWKTNELYTQGNMVVYNDKIYICDSSHTSTSTFDPTKWHEISSNDIDNWQTSTAYNVGDMVVRGGQLYRCITAHTSDSNDFSNDIANWQTLDTKWKAVNWDANTLYIAGEVLLYNNTQIKCTTTHISASTYELDKDNWETLSANIREWVSGNTYKVGDIVLYNNEIWKCTASNNSNLFEKDKWRQINKCNIERWHGAPDNNILALLHFDNSADLYHNEYGDSFTGSPKCTQTSALFDGCNYSLKVGDYGELRSPIYSFPTGNEVYTLEYWFRNEQHWNMFNETIMMPFFDGYSATAYTSSLCVIRDPQGNQIGTFNEWQIVHIAQVITGTESTVYLNGVSLGTITRSTANADVSFYMFYSQNFTKARLDELRISAIARYTSNFTPKREIFPNPNYDGYKVNDLVVYNDKIYRAIVDNNDVEFTPSKWIEVSSANTPLWETNIYYGVGDIVIYDNQTYRCITAHTSNTFLGDIANWQALDTNWLVNDWVVNKLYLEHQVVSYDNCLWKCLETHESTLDDSPANAKLYTAGTNVLYVDGSTVTPYSEIIDLGSVQKVTDFSYTGVVNGMSIAYNVETSADGVTFSEWEDVLTNARYIKLIVESLTVYQGATSPNAYLSNFAVVGESSRWEKISSGGADIELAKKSDIDEMFV